MNPSHAERWPAALARGFVAPLPSYALIAAISGAIAVLLWIDDTRPFWHPLVTCLCYGFSVAYCVNVAQPWDKPKPILRLAFAVAAGAVVGVALVIVLKGYGLDHITERWKFFALNVLGAFLVGLFVSLFFYLRNREARADAALARAESERHLLSKQAVEAELKLMQAQVEPHFLFNTLASVQFLTETDPPAATRMLGHLIDYLRAALPQLRASSSTLGREAELAEAYLNILQMRMGGRLTFAVDVHEALRAHPFPPNLLISLVENAVKHGVEPAIDGGRIALTARRDGERLVVSVEDTGRGLVDENNASTGGVGLSNVRERLAALYGSRGRFVLEGLGPRGARATIDIPVEA